MDAEIPTLLGTKRRIRLSSASEWSGRRAGRPLFHNSLREETWHFLAAGNDATLPGVLGRRRARGEGRRAAWQPGEMGGGARAPLLTVGSLGEAHADAW